QEFGVERAGELIASLSNLIANLELQILKGNKVVEIRNIAINKGRAALKWIERKKWDMIISIGDDTTDEDIFKNLPDDAVSIKVGEGPTYAKYTLKNPHEVRDFLLEFLK
ncbi:MAG: bifunctional alpha,alpha-trehalose-phosphate synthase (UDP-forming)/trehalose-phosphatase, partial [Caldiserica bacterium]